MVKRNYYSYIHIGKESELPNELQRIVKYAQRRNYVRAGRFVDIGSDSERTNLEKLISQAKKNDIIVCTNILTLSADYKLASSYYLALLQKGALISFTEDKELDAERILKEFDAIDELGYTSQLPKELFLQVRIKVTLELTKEKIREKQHNENAGFPRGKKMKLTEELKEDIKEYLYGEERQIRIKELMEKHDVGAYATMAKYIEIVRKETEDPS